MTDRSSNGYAGRRRFLMTLIKPSHYDNDGYVIQWWKAWIPSNSLASLYGLTLDIIAGNKLGDIDIELEAYDEMNIVLPLKSLIKRFRANDNFGLVCLTGVQSNQFPRAMDIARPLIDAGIQVAVGGFHVSGCISMLDELPDDLQAAQDMGVSFFAGEAEGRLADLIGDAVNNRLQPIYNYMDDLPDLSEQVVPFLPEEMLRRYDGSLSSFDAGRGCPYQCSFCTIINVQGRKSRYRSADDIEKIIRRNHAQGVTRFFVTDDNFARNKNWEAIFDRIIELRENDGLGIHFLIQVDTLCHKIPRFVEKAVRAGCSHVFIGLENIDPDNLKAVNKNQNQLTEYRRLFQIWREAGVLTYAGYIIGFPIDTPDTLKRNIEILQREIPVDVLEFTILTPLPGSADHKALTQRGIWMDPDMNRYDLEHTTTEHPLMSQEQLQQAYRDIWDIYFSDAHVETLMRRMAGYGHKPIRIWQGVLAVYGSMRYERLHPQQSGFFRRKIRTQRRPNLPMEPALIFYPKRVWQVLATYVPWGLYAWRLNRMRKRIEKDPAKNAYTDLAMTPVENAAHEELEMFDFNEAARASVTRARSQDKAKDKAKDKARQSTKVASS